MSELMTVLVLIRTTRMEGIETIDEQSEELARDLLHIFMWRKSKP